MKSIILRFTLASLLLVAGAAAAVLLLAMGVGDGSLAKLKKRIHTAESGGWSQKATALQALEWQHTALADEPKTGGALTQLPGVGIVAASADGVFYQVVDADEPVRLAIPSPLNSDVLNRHPVHELPTFHWQYFRVNDILLLDARTPGGGYDIYSTHHFFNAEQACVEWRLSHIRLTREGSTLVAADGGWQPLVIAEPCAPIRESGNPTYYAFNGDVSGGRMLLWDADTLMVSSGEFQLYEKAQRPLSQDPDSQLGKILLVDRNTGKTSIYASGVRNPQGLWRDDRGRVWETEHGPRGGDELNLIREGGNYGWPIATYGMNYDLRPWRDDGREGVHEFGTPPAMAFVPSLGTSVVIQVDGRRFPNWQGDLLIGTLLSQKLVRVRLDGDRPVYAEQIAMPGFRIRDLDVMPDGSIIALSNRMELITIRALDGGTQSGATDALSVDRIVEQLPEARADLVRAGADAFRAECMKCHGLGVAVSSAPSLQNVIGRAVASLQGYAYTPALAQVWGKWTEARLAEFLADPEAFAPGQAMPAPQLESRTREAIAAFLAESQNAQQRAAEGGSGEVAAGG